MRRLRERIKLFVAGLFFLSAAVGILWSVAQIPIVREFLSRASGEPANIRVDVLAVTGPLNKPWQNYAQGGEGFDWKMTPIINQVKPLQPKYIRLDHIYDFYEIVGGTPGNLTFDFSKMDPILDDIKAAGATPYIALTYMPPAIAEGDIVSKPKRWEDWQLVVQKTVEHISGTRNTPNVYYEVWNEPDLFGGWKYYGDKNYLTLYTYAERGARNAKVNQTFKIGGPAITALYKNWFTALMKHAQNNNLRLDFLSWHRYNLSIEQFREDASNARTWLQDFPAYQNIELHITEWGHDSNNHPGYDTRFGAAHTVAGSIEMIDTVDKAFVFEIQDGKDPKGQAAWGRWGLLQHQSVGSAPKPRYHALVMLNKLGNLRLQLFGKGTWVKAVAALDSSGNPQVMLVNYDQSGRNVENVPVTFENIIPGQYTLSKEFLGAAKQNQLVATDAGVLQVNIPMTANSIVLLGLQPVIPTSGAAQ
jgi:hypothetical protein